MEPTRIPSEIPGERARFAESQPQYRPVDGVRQRNLEYQCWSLVLAYVPEPDELLELAKLLQGHLEMSGELRIQQAIPITPIVDALRAAFVRLPIIMTHLSGSGAMVPHNLHVGVPDYLRDPSRA